MTPVPSSPRTLLHCLSHDKETPTRDSATASGLPDGRTGVHGAWMGRRAKRYCPAGVRGNAEAAEKVCRWSNVLDTASKTPDAMGALGERHHSKVAGANQAWAKTRVKSVGCARWRMEGRLGGSGVDVEDIAAGQIAAVAHCSDRTGDSCSETRRKGTDAAESGTGRYTAERPS